MDYETEIREAIFKLRNETSQTLVNHGHEMDDRDMFALMLSALLNAVEEGLVVLSRQVESLRGFDTED